MRLTWSWLIAFSIKADMPVAVVAANELRRKSAYRSKSLNFMFHLLTLFYSIRQLLRNISSISELFFPRLPPTARLAHPVGWAPGQVVVDLAPTAANRVDIHTGNLRQPFCAAMPDAFGFQRYVPASLLFIEPTQQNIHAMVVVFVCMWLRRLTYLTLTLMDRSLAHLSDSWFESSTRNHFTPSTANLLTDSYLVL